MTACVSGTLQLSEGICADLLASSPPLGASQHDVLFISITKCFLLLCFVWAYMVCTGSY